MPSFDYSAFLTQAAADARYQALGSLGSATPGSADVNDAGTAGVSTSASRADHEHPVPSATPSSVVLTGTNAAGSATTHVRSDHGDSYSPPHCELWNSAAQSLGSSGAWQALTFDTEEADATGMHSTVSNTSRITVATAGVYLISGGCEFAGNATGRRGIGLRTNSSGTNAPNKGFTVEQTDNLTTSGITQQIAVARKLAANDYIELVAFQSSGGALNVNTNGERNPYFTATWIGVG